MRLSALVVTFNEEKHLEECLRSLASCTQLLVVDLGSVDRSIQIARKYTSHVIQHAWEPIAELVLPKVLDKLESEWFIRTDPDEIVPAQLFFDIERCCADNPEAGIIEIPFLYYYLGKPLTTTVWGGVRCFPKVLNKNRIMVPNGVHQAFVTRQGFCTAWIRPTDHNVVRHYWIDSIPQLKEKHRRYLALEGQSRFQRGGRFSWRGMARATMSGLRESLISKKGWQGGWTGWYLSFFYAEYVASAWLSLRRYRNTLEQP